MRCSTAQAACSAQRAACCTTLCQGVAWGMVCAQHQQRTRHAVNARIMQPQSVVHHAGYVRARLDYAHHERCQGQGVQPGSVRVLTSRLTQPDECRASTRQHTPAHQTSRGPGIVDAHCAHGIGAWAVVFEISALCRFSFQPLTYLQLYSSSQAQRRHVLWPAHS